MENGKMQRDESGLAFAQKNGIRYLMVNRETGVIWNFSITRYTRSKLDYYRQFGHMRDCVVMTVAEYVKLTK
jgi:hypothetical protein